jgi:hypothetical protein
MVNKKICIVASEDTFLNIFSVYDKLKKDFDTTFIHINKFNEKNNFCSQDIHYSIIDSIKETKVGNFNSNLYGKDNQEYLKDKEQVIKDLICYIDDLGQLGEIRDKLKLQFQKIKPDLVIIFGDCISSLSSCLTCKILNIDVAHIGSGLRNNDIKCQKEVNRILIDNLTKYHFVTEQSGVYNLQEI